MFGLAKREREALNSLIETQREEIHWLRSCIPWAVPAGADTPPIRATGKDALPEVLEGTDRLFMTEDEEDLQHFFDSGEINKEELEELLRAAGARSTEVEVFKGD